MPETAVKERPILFSTDMVCAILAGTKAQTRRIVKPQPSPKTRFVEGPSSYHEDWAFGSKCVSEVNDPYNFFVDQRAKCPFGQPGDCLWVREAWQYEDAEYEHELSSTNPVYPERVWYRADDPEAGPWRPSIHMPRWASRITLEVTDVWVERLSSISEDDAKAEGIPKHVAEHTFRKCYRDPQERARQRIDYFRELWDSINTNPGIRWEDDPWVWVVEFRKLDDAS